MPRRLLVQRIRTRASKLGWAAGPRERKAQTIPAIFWFTMFHRAKNDDQSKTTSHYQPVTPTEGKTSPSSSRIPWREPGTIEWPAERYHAQIRQKQRQKLIELETSSLLKPQKKKIVWATIQENGKNQLQGESCCGQWRTMSHPFWKWASNAILFSSTWQLHGTQLIHPWTISSSTSLQTKNYSKMPMFKSAKLLHVSKLCEKITFSKFLTF